MSALFLLLLSSLVFSVSSTSPDSCLSHGKQQKLSPSVEPGLRKCQQYASSACCFSDHLHTELVSPFPWDQCGPLSSRCEVQLSQLECMYLCSPHISKWGDPESDSGIKRLPLCSEFCNQWFDACKDDLICPGIHATNANCSRSCISYRQAFSSGRHLCDGIWETSFVAGNKPNLCITPQSSKVGLSREEPISEYLNTQEEPSLASENQHSLSKGKVRRAIAGDVTAAADLDNTLEGASGLSDIQNTMAKERLRRDINVNPTSEDVVDNSQEGSSGTTDFENILPSDRKRRDFHKRSVFTEVDNAEEGPSGSSEMQKVLPKERRRRALVDPTPRYLDNNQEGPSGSSEPQNVLQKDRTKRSDYVDPTAADVDNPEDGASGSSVLQNLLPKQRAKRALRKRSVFLEDVEGSGSTI